MFSKFGHEMCQRISYYEQKNALFYRNMNDVGLKLLAKQIKRESLKINKRLQNWLYFEKVKAFYNLFVTIILRRIRKQLKKLDPILNLLCSLPK